MERRRPTLPTSHHATKPPAPFVPKLTKTGIRAMSIMSAPTSHHRHQAFMASPRPRSARPSKARPLLRRVVAPPPPSSDWTERGRTVSEALLPPGHMPPGLPWLAAAAAVWRRPPARASGACYENKICAGVP